MVGAILEVVLDCINDAEVVFNDWCDEAGLEYSSINSITYDDDGTINAVITTLDNETETLKLPLNKIITDTSVRYLSIEYSGSGQYKCSEFRAWDTLTDDEKRAVLKSENAMLKG